MDNNKLNLPPLKFKKLPASEKFKSYFALELAKAFPDFTGEKIDVLLNSTIGKAALAAHLSAIK